MSMYRNTGGSWCHDWCLRPTAPRHLSRGTTRPRSAGTSLNLSTRSSQEQIITKTFTRSKAWFTARSQWLSQRARWLRMIEKFSIFTATDSETLVPAGSQLVWTSLKFKNQQLFTAFYGITISMVNVFNFFIYWNNKNMPFWINQECWDNIFDWAIALFLFTSQGIRTIFWFT